MIVRNQVMKLGYIPIDNSIYGVSNVIVEHKYKHVGSFGNWRYSDITESKYRATEAKTPLKEVNSIIKTRSSSISMRRFLISSLAMSRLRVNISSVNN